MPPAPPILAAYHPDAPRRSFLFTANVLIGSLVVTTPPLGFPFIIDTVTIWQAAAAGTVPYFWNLFISDDDSTATTFPPAGDPLYKVTSANGAGELAALAVPMRHAVRFQPRFVVRLPGRRLKSFWNVGGAGTTLGCLVDLIPLA